MRDTAAVFVKELTDAIRDRRSAASALLYSLMGPLVIAMALSWLAGQGLESGLLKIGVEGGERAPALIAWLGQRGVEAAPAPGGAEAAVRSGAVEVAVEIPPDFAERYLRNEPAPLRMIHDSSRKGGRGDVRRTQTLLASWSREVGAARLVSRGIDPSAISTVDLEERDLATPRAKATLALSMLPIYLLVGAFVGGMNVAIDATAGERERSSLESLLATPVPPSALVAGKWLAAVVFAAAGVAASLAATMALLGAIEFKGLGLRLAIGPADAAAIFGILAPLVLLAPALQMLLAIGSRSFKEAQTHLSFLLFIPMLPGFALTFGRVTETAWMTATPILSQQILLDRILRGEGTGPVTAILAAAATLAACAASLVASARLLRSEKVVLGR